jgi:hypothetical protein
MSITVMKQALEALEAARRGHCDHAWADEAITALRTAIEAAEKQEPRHIVQSNGRHSPLLTHMMNSRTTPPAAPVQEPVATKLETQQFNCFHVSAEDFQRLKALPVGTKLYTTPPAQPAQRKPLTDEQRRKLMSEAWNKWLSGKDDGSLFAWDFSFEVEAAHGIKEDNT